MTNSAAAARLELPAVMDLTAAAPLAAELLALRGQAVSLDASAVERLGGLCLQVLLSARATWAADGVALTFERASAALRETLALAGAGALNVSAHEAQA